MKPWRQLAIDQALKTAPALPAPTTSRRNGIVDSGTRFSPESSAVRWLYSTVADKRTFISYLNLQRGKPAELHVAVRRKPHPGIPGWGFFDCNYQETLRCQQHRFLDFGLAIRALVLAKVGLDQVGKGTLAALGHLYVAGCEL